MTEQEFKKMFERHAESVMMEIWKPIEAKVNKTLELMVEKTTLFEHKLGLVHKRQLKLRREFTQLNLSIQDSIKKMKESISFQQSYNDHLESKVYKKVKSQVNDAIEYGKKAEELYKTNIPDFQGMVTDAKKKIKDECDLRIMDILKLEKRYRELLDEGKESSIIIK